MSVLVFDRRGFLQSAAALATVGALASDAIAAPRYRMGLQLYTIREPMAQDPAGTLAPAATLGYRNYEIYGFESESL